jgi:hypothetical protein
MVSVRTSPDLAWSPNVLSSTEPATKIVVQSVNVVPSIYQGGSRTLPLGEWNSREVARMQKVPELSRIVFGAPPRPVRGGGNISSFIRYSSPESNSSPTSDSFSDDGQERSGINSWLLKKKCYNWGV